MRGLGSKSFGVGGPVVFLLLVSGASATTITFDGLTGFHTPFTTYTESGFAATVTNGIWGQGQAEGNPVPSIFTGTGAFGGPASNTIALTEGGSRFAFNGLDLAANFSTANYEFLGTRGGSTVFDLTGTQSDLTGFGNFQTVGGGVSLDPIDTLTVAINDSLDTANIDNIIVQPLPETPKPATITFNGLTGFHTPFTTYNESGYNVTVTSGVWGQGQAEGDPVPSVFTGTGAFGGPAENTFAITASGSQFEFSGLDLAANFNTAKYEFLGTRGGSTVFDLAGTLSDLTSFGDFQMVGGGVSLDSIDTLWVTINDSLDTANIDNIVLGPAAGVPEPPAIEMFAIGLALFGVWHVARARHDIPSRIVAGTRSWGSRHLVDFAPCVARAAAPLGVSEE
jgi:hypothetical protein